MHIALSWEKKPTADAIFLVVIPAKAGIQGCKNSLVALDPSPDLIRGFRRGDG